MFLSDWRNYGRTHRQPSERLETIVANSQRTWTAILVIYLVVVILSIERVGRYKRNNTCMLFPCRLTEESMRWLEIQGKHDKVLNELKKIANVNKKPLPDFRPDAEAAVIFLLFKTKQVHIYIYMYAIRFLDVRSYFIRI